MSIPLNQTGKKIQNYIFNYCDFLGAGNFSKCYKGYNEVTNEVVAIKIVQLNSLKSKKLEQLLFQQIQILKKLNHPSVLKCYQIFTSNRNCYIITELCNQGNLQNKLKLKRVFDQNEANPIIKDVYDGLLYLAQKNIVHRDLKSANIFLHDGRAKIADFGFAKQINHNFKDLNIGSPLYMAPQGILQNIYGPKTEVWALGILVYELFHGSSPYIYCKTQQELKRSVMIPINWNQLRQQLSQDVKQFILTCLEINQQIRATIQQLGNLGYVRRLHHTNLSYGSSKLQMRSPSRSVHMTEKVIKNVNRSSLQRTNNNFRTQNNTINRQNSMNKNERQVVFRSVDMRNNNNAFQFVSPKRPQIPNQNNKYNMNSPNRSYTMNPLQPLNQADLVSIGRKQFTHNYMNQGPSYQSSQFPVLQQHQQNMFPVTSSISPATSPQFYQNNTVNHQQIRNRPLSSHQNQMVPQQVFDSIGYNSMNGFGNYKKTFQNNQNINILQSQQDNFVSHQSTKTHSPSRRQNSKQSSMFKQRISFKQAIFFIHHCRLIFKFTHFYKDTPYFQQAVYLQIFKYMMSILYSLKQLAQHKQVVIQGQKSSIKIKKFKQVTLQYLSKYKKELDQNNYHIQHQLIQQGSLETMKPTILQVYKRLNDDISLILRKNRLTSSQENMIVLGHLCIVIIASLKQIQDAFHSNNFQNLLKFKHIQTVLNTPKQQFSVSSYKAYRLKFIK